MSPVPASAPKRTSAPPPIRQEQMAQQPKMTGKIVTEEAKATEPLRITTKNISQDSISSSEICLSPAWSDHGQKERKEKKRQQEKADKELKRKQEEENRKAPKRLNKKPPAAMDTQKMSADLRRPRRNSLMSLVPSRSSSREPSVERGREEKRFSGSSFTSFLRDRRSSSQQRPTITSPVDDKSPEKEGTSQQFKPIVSPLAPKLPSFRWKMSSSADGKAHSWGPNNVSDGELVGFPYGKEDSVLEKTEESDANTSPIAHLAQEPRIRPMIRSTTEPDLRPEAVKRRVKAAIAPVTERDPKKDQLSLIAKDAEPATKTKDQVSKPSSRKENNSDARSPDRKPQERQRSDQVAAELIAMLSDNKHKPYQHVQTQAPKSYNTPPRDGSSYVHKQRMYQQQRSIAGFEEQQALQMFNEQAAIADIQQDIRDVQTAGKDGSTAREASPSSDKRNRSSSRGTKGANRSSSPAARSTSQPPKQSGLSPLKQVSTAPEVSEDERERKLKNAKEEILQKMQAAQLGKSDRILGFRRKHKDAPSAISIPDNKQKHSAVSSTPDVDGLQESAAQPKQSRRDRMSAHIPFRHRRDSSSTGIGLNGARQSTDQVRKAPEAKNFYKDANGTSPPSSAKVAESPRQPVQHSMTGSKTSSESGESWHSTQEPKRRSQSAAPKSKPKPKPSMDSSVLAASYTEIIKTPSSEEESLSDKSPNSSTHDHQEESLSNAEPTTKTATSENIVRKSSITHSRSIPNLQTYHSNFTAPDSNGSVLPNLDFLPQLKHQALTKSPRRSTQTSAESSPTREKIGFAPVTNMPDTSYKSSLASSTLATGVSVPDLSLLPRSPFRALPSASRSATSVLPTATTTTGQQQPKDKAADGSQEAKPIAKLFVICCKCRFWHDLPSKLYEAMALPKELRRADGGEGKVEEGKSKKKEEKDGEKQGEKEEVKCSWCEHKMRTSCCQGWTTVVYLHKRHH